MQDKWSRDSIRVHPFFWLQVSMLYCYLHLSSLIQIYINFDLQSEGGLAPLPIDNDQSARKALVTIMKRQARAMMKESVAYKVEKW